VVVATSGSGKELGGRMACLARQVRAAAEHLEAAVLSALVERTVGVDYHVPDFARSPMGATVQLPVDYQSATNTGRPCDVDHVPRAATGPAVEFTKPRHVSVIRDVGWGAGGAPEHCCERDVPPSGEVRRVNQDASLDVDWSRGADCDAAHLLTASMPFDLGRRPFDHSLRAAEKRGSGLEARDQLAVRARKRNAHLRPTKVDPSQHC
jgi:hypothetical protein